MTGEEPAVSYGWTGWVWGEITGGSSRLLQKITHRYRGIYRIYPNFIKENRRMSTCNRLDLQTLGSQPVNMPKNILDRWCYDRGGPAVSYIWTGWRHVHIMLARRASVHRSDSWMAVHRKRIHTWNSEIVFPTLAFSERNYICFKLLLFHWRKDASITKTSSDALWNDSQDAVRHRMVV